MSWSACLLAAAALGMLATPSPGRADADLSAYHWKKRLLLVFSPGADDPELKRQEIELSAHRAGVTERDLVVFRVVADEPVTRDGMRDDWVANVAMRETFEVPTGTFAAVLIGKDGGTKLRRTRAITMTELFSLIDSMPMRRDEMRAGQSS